MDGLKIVGAREKLRKTFKLLASVTVWMCSLTVGDEEFRNKISQNWLQKYEVKGLWLEHRDLD